MRVSHAFVTHRLVGGLFCEICKGYGYHTCRMTDLPIKFAGLAPPAGRGRLCQPAGLLLGPYMHEEISEWLHGGSCSQDLHA